ncbi:Uncharacterised protein [Mycobacteroides abscessus]|nr:Uncharacterised protein [Mycobacteroides abscessus]
MEKHSRTAWRRATGQVAGSPSGVSAHTTSRARRPTSLPDVASSNQLASAFTSAS